MENNSKCANNTRKTKKRNFQRKGPKTKTNYGDQYDRDSSGKTHDNDASWYTLGGRLTQDVASLQFNNAIGNVIELTSHTDVQGKYNAYRGTLPGIMEMKFIPSVGIAASKNDPINTAGYNIFTTLRKVMSGTRSYEPADLMMYLVAMDSAYMYLGYMMRLYGVAHIFSQRNKYIGRALIQACGGNNDDIVMNLATLRSYINIYITRLSPFCVPRVMNYFNRHFWLVSNIFKDSDVDRAQLYLANPAYVYIWHDTGASGSELIPRGVSCGGALDPSGHLTNMRLNVSSIMAIGNDILAALYSSEDVATMSGDIMKAYEGNLWTLTYMPEDYVVVPVYNEEVSNQIHNTKFAGFSPCLFDGTTSIDAFKVTQNPNIDQGTIQFRPYFKGAAHLVYDMMLDMFHDNPTPEEVMVASRNMTMANAMSNVEDLYQIETTGSELFLYSNVWQYNIQGTPGPTMVYTSATDGPTAALEKFRGRPINYDVRYGTGSFALNNIWGDIHNYTVLSLEQLWNIHNVALSSLFGIPMLGSTEIIKK